MVQTWAGIAVRRRDAVRVLADWDDRGRFVWTLADLATLFPNESSRSLEASVARLLDEEILIRCCRGVYRTARARSFDPFLLQHIAVALRRGHYSYVSLESALSMYGVISQIPIGGLTVMTTGRRGWIDVENGWLEFVHTERSVTSILDSVADVGRPLRLARVRTALEDQRHVGRCLDLVDMEEFAEIEAEMEERRRAAA